MENQPNPESLKQLATAIVDALKALDSELLAYQMTLTALHRERPQDALFFEASLGLAKLSKQYQAILHERYDSILEQFLRRVSDGQTVVEACEEWLRARKTTNPVN
jgi:hypothetical protein